LAIKLKLSPNLQVSPKIIDMKSFFPR